MKIHKITWHDHFSDSEWKTKEEIKKWVDSRMRDKPCVSVGFIVYESKDSIAIAGSFDGDENYGDIIVIQKVDIKSKRRLV